MASHADGTAAGGCAHVYDLIVIGGGSGGIATAKRAAGHGARVALVEVSGAGRLGGTCVNVGCVPKKVMWHAAELAGGFALAPAYGFGVGAGGGDGGSGAAAPPSAAPALSMRHLKAARDAYVARLNGLYARGLQSAGVTVYDGRAALTGRTVEGGDDGEAARSDSALQPRSRLRRHVVAVTPTHGSGGGAGGAVQLLLEAPHVVLATGSRARLPPIPGIASHAITSDGFFELDAVPPSAAILGGGYIACELAGILASLGTAVTLLPRRADGLLAGFDESLRAAAAESLAALGVRVQLGTAVTEITPAETAAAAGAGALLVRVAAPPPASAAPDGSAPSPPSSSLLGPFSVVIAATGRSPNSEGLGLEAAGVATVASPSPAPGYAWAHMLADEEEEGEGEGGATDAASSWRRRCGLAGGVGASAHPACPPPPPQAATAGADTHAAPVPPGRPFAPAVDVDAFQNTSVPGIYAVGDVTGRAQLTPVAIAAGRLLADRLFDPRHARGCSSGGVCGASTENGAAPPPPQPSPSRPLPRLEYDAIPSVVFTHPPLGSVGLTEAEARATYEAAGGESPQRVDVWTSSFTPLMHGLLQVAAQVQPQPGSSSSAGGSGAGTAAPTSHAQQLPPPTRCRVKLVTVGPSQRVVGLHLAGPGADEALQGFAVAVRMGATKADLDAAVAIHPTFAEEAVTLAPWRPRPPAVAAAGDGARGGGGPLELRRRAGGDAATDALA